MKYNTMGRERQHSGTQNGVEKLKSVWEVVWSLRKGSTKAEIIRHPNTGCRTTAQVCRDGAQAYLCHELNTRHLMLQLNARIQQYTRVLIKGNLDCRIHEVILAYPPVNIIWGIEHNKVCTHIEEPRDLAGTVNILKFMIYEEIWLI